MLRLWWFVINFDVSFFREIIYIVAKIESFSYSQHEISTISTQEDKTDAHVCRRANVGNDSAPAEIIYMIAMHYIFGFNGEIEGKTASEIQALYPNFKMADTAELAKEGKLAKWVEGAFR